MVKLWLSPLILYGKRLPGLLIETMEFHHIGLPDQTESQRTHGEAVFNPYTATGLAVLLMNFLMHDPAFDGKKVLIPSLLYMNKGAAARAIVIMGKRRDHY
jgi:hypothetical protein